VSFFPELDFSVFDTLEQFEAVWPAEAREGGAVTSTLEPIVWAGRLPPTDEPEGFVLRDEPAVHSRLASGDNAVQRPGRVRRRSR
jgi:hypothetical protein